MGKSFIQFRGHGFWVRDTPLEVWLRLATLHLGYRSWDGTAFMKVRETWLSATSGCNGFVGDAADLDGVLANEELLSAAVEASEDTLKSIRRIGPKLDAKHLNALGLPGIFTTDFDAWEVQQVGEHFVRLLRGELDWEVRSSPCLPTEKLIPLQSEVEAAKLEAEAQERERDRLAAEKDAAITDNRCPHCGVPCPSYRKTCKACKKPVRGSAAV